METAWIKRTTELVAWAKERLVVRDDCYGTYYFDDSKNAMSGVTKHEPLNDSIMKEHFAGHRTIGLHTTSPEDRCKWLCIDLDQHDENPTREMLKNIDDFAFHVDDVLVKNDMQALLTDSNGNGGRHLFVLFSDWVSAEFCHYFGKWLVRDYRKFGFDKEPEVFPKQTSIKGGLGNWLRLFGKHYTREHWTKVYKDGWKEGERAVGAILAARPNCPGMIPVEVLSWRPKEPGAVAGAVSVGAGGCSGEDAWMKAYRGDLRTLDIKTCLEQARGVFVEDRGDQFAIRCPWAHEHTTPGDTASIRPADEVNGFFPTFHCFHSHCEHRRIKDLLDWIGKDSVDAHCSRVFSGGMVVSMDDQQDIVAKFIKSHDNAFRFYRGEFYKYSIKNYVVIDKNEMFGDVYGWLETCLMRDRKTNKLVPLRFTAKSAKDIVECLKAKLLEPTARELPSWLNDGPDPAGIIAFRNCLFNIKDGSVMDHSPEWFSINYLPRDFDADARCPLWLKFLDEVFEGDQERIDTLQMWFGLNLTSETKYQKGLILKGEPRSGKGTITRILEAIIGSHNVANPNLTGLGTHFGLADLVGKTAAIINEGHLGKFADNNLVLETLKGIIGEDSLTINRKHLPSLSNVRLKTRFTIATNDLPRFADVSNALVYRFIIIPFDVNFQGREDLDLEAKLRGELSGILNWSLEGLRMLRSAGQFTQPRAGIPHIEQFRRLSSPVATFLEECCSMGEDESVNCELLYNAWKSWCAASGHESGSKEGFGSKLSSVKNRIQRKQARENGARVYKYYGVGLGSDPPDF